MVEVRVDVKCCSHHQQRLEFVKRGGDVSCKPKTPDLQESLQVKENSEGHLDEKRVKRVISHLAYYNISQFKIP